MKKQIITCIIPFFIALQTIGCKAETAHDNHVPTAGTLEIEGPKERAKIKIQEICVGGNIYVIAISGDGYSQERGVAMVQAFNALRSYDIAPKKC